MEPLAALVWTAFVLLVLAILALDLGVFHRRDHAPGVRESVSWTLVYVTLGLLFGGFVYALYEHHWFGFGAHAGMQASGAEALMQYLTGFLIEKSLSLDNIFVIALIFAYFGVPLQYQHRVLFWGILGALVLRGVMIGVGAALIHKFEWIIYVFGVILLVSAVKMWRAGHEDIHPDRNPFVRLVRRFYPVTSDLHGHSFFARVGERRAATPLLLALVLVESADIMFAVDSIPAIFAITHDPFIVFTSNVFAILGLRSLYFVLASLNNKFRYLRHSLVLMLAYIGVKMLLSHAAPIPTHVSLIVIVLLLAGGMLATPVVAWRRRRRTGG